MNTDLSIDTLITALKDEAKQRLIPDRTEQTFTTSGVLPDPASAHYHAGEFLCIESDSDFVDSLYQCLLGRPVDPVSLDNCLNAMSSTKTRATLLLELNNSSEAYERKRQILGLTWTIRLHKLETRFPTLSKPLKKVIQLIYKIEELTACIVIQKKINTHLSKKIESLHSLETTQLQQRCQLAQFEQHLATLRFELQLAQRQARPKLTDDKASLIANETKSYRNQEGRDFQQFYLAFENRFRGTAAEIHAKLNQYLDYLPKLSEDTNTILDIGCGRGEWLGIIKQAGYQEIGIDANQVMIDVCKKQGLNVNDTPLHEWLSQADDNFLCGMTGFHIAEHLPFEYLLSLLQEAVRVLKPGGVLILETPNPENTSVGSHSFYHDPTHRNPLTPSLMQFVAEYIGLVNIQIARLNPLPKDQHFSGDNHENHFLNAKFCSAQDYALIAYKPDHPEKMESRN